MIKYLIHSNKYGWAIRLGGWTGPRLGCNYSTKEEAIRAAREGRRGIDWALEPAAEHEIMVIG